jgi:hypothetical protein
LNDFCLVFDDFGPWEHLAEEIRLPLVATFVVVGPEHVVDVHVAFGVSSGQGVGGSPKDVAIPVAGDPNVHSYVGGVAKSAVEGRVTSVLALAACPG